LLLAVIKQLGLGSPTMTVKASGKGNQSRKGSKLGNLVNQTKLDQIETFIELNSRLFSLFRSMCLGTLGLSP